MERRAAHADHAFVVHHSVGGGIQSQQTLVDDDPVCFGHLLGDESHHLFERDIRQSRLVLGVASSDVGVVAGERGQF